ncbi:hypothetical protein ACFX13_028098 [Malus domestica]
MGPIFQLTWRKKDKALTCKAQYLLKRQAFPLINAVVEFLPAVASILLSRRRGAFAHLLSLQLNHGPSNISLQLNHGLAAHEFLYLLPSRTEPNYLDPVQNNTRQTQPKVP